VTVEDKGIRSPILSVRGELYWILPIVLATMSITVWLLINPKWGGDVAAIIVIPLNVAAVLVPLLMGYSARGVDARKLSRSKARKLKIAVAFTSAALVLMGGTYWVNLEEDPREYLSGTVRIGVVNEDYPGWNAIKGGRREGFDVALAEFLSGEFSFKIEYVSLPSRSDRLSALLPDAKISADLVIANFSITPEREEKIDFAGPYFIDNQGFYTYQSDKEKIEDIRPDEVCVAKGTTAHQRLKDLGWQPKESASLAMCIQNLLTRSDTNAVSTDTSILEAYAKARGMATPSPIEIGQERYGVGIPNGRPKLCAELNKAIDKFLSDRWLSKFEEHLDGVSNRGEHIPETTAPCK
jgi:ABC-type amino acid transport substrate-binding protein